MNNGLNNNNNLNNLNTNNVNQVNQVSGSEVVNPVVTNETNQAVGGPTPDVKFCTVCGKPLDVKGECPYCKLAAMAEEYQKEYYEEEKKTTSTSAVVFLILSILNLLIVFPFVSKFALLWLLFGAFSGDPAQYYWVLGVCCGYMGASILGLIGFIVNIIKNGSFLKGAFIILVIGFALGVSVPYVIPAAAPVIEKASTKETKIEEGAIIYQDENYIIKQKSITKSARTITLTINVEKLNPNAGKIIFYNNVSINYLYLQRDYNHSDAPIDSGEKTFTIKIPSDLDIPVGDISTCSLYFTYGLTQDHVAKFKIDGREIDIEKIMKHNGYEIAIDDEYFKVYYKPHSDDYDISLYVEGKGDTKNSISIGKVDADTPGYETMISLDQMPLSDHNTAHLSISANGCKENMSYLMIYYSIYDENNKKIVDNQVAKKRFDSSQYGKDCSSK